MSPRSLSYFPLQYIDYSPANMCVAALLLVMFPILMGFQRCGPSPCMHYKWKKESPELNIIHLRDRNQSFFFERFIVVYHAVIYWMPCWFIFCLGELVVVEPQHPISSIIVVYLTLDSSLFLAMNPQTRAHQIGYFKEHDVELAELGVSPSSHNKWKALESGTWMPDLSLAILRRLKFWPNSELFSCLYNELNIVDLHLE